MSIDQFHLNNFIDNDQYHPKERRGRFLITHFNNSNSKSSKKKRFTIHVLEHEYNTMRKSPSFEVFIEPLPERRELNKSISEQRISKQQMSIPISSKGYSSASSSESIKENVCQYFDLNPKTKNNKDKDENTVDDLISF